MNSRGQLSPGQKHTLSDNNVRGARQLTPGYMKSQPIPLTLSSWESSLLGPFADKEVRQIPFASLGLSLYFYGT